MSGIAGILHLDGRPVACDDVATMTATMAHRGPDGINHWVAGPVGLGHCMLRTTPQSLHESQPLRDESGDLCLTLAGRVDNRAELRADLDAARHHLRDDTDAELVLQAYRCWGTDCITRIIGDFAFALWDGRRRELVCARDFLGKRPFYYSFNGSTFRWASEPQAVMADPAVPREPNKGMIGEYLAAAVTSTTETVFRHLLRLAPAHFLVVTPSGLRITRYWEWDPACEIRYPDDREYTSHFLDVFASAVEARLASPWPVAAELSGGVDSSSVVGVVEYLRRAGRHDTPLEAYSMVFPGRCDETVYSRAVARHCGVVAHEVQPQPASAELYEAQVGKYLDLPNYPNMMIHLTHFAAAKEKGCRVVLSGQGGDEWLEGNLYTYADSLRQLRLHRLMSDVHTSAPGAGSRSSIAALWQWGVKPQLPVSLRHLARRATGRTLPTWLDASFCHDIDLADRTRTRSRRRGASFANDMVATSLDDGWQAHAAEFSERAIASMGQEYRHPFDDRRVVELALAVPPDQRRRGDVSKYVLRAAMAGLIPEGVRTRRDKGEFSHVFYEDLRLQGGSKLFTGMLVAELGWVDGRKALAMYDQLDHYFRHGGNHPKNVWPLWTILSVDRWLSAVI